METCELPTETEIIANSSFPASHMTRWSFAVSIADGAPCAPRVWPPASDAPARGAALRQFLQCCRARVSPLGVGISAVRRRRIQGLRQEDVAKLAGVSPRWYEVFERGKTCRRFSPAFVARIACALRLDAHERAALFRLALPEVAEAVEYFERIAPSNSHP